MKIPGFDILDKIGEDRSTTVWQANQNTLNRTVALKILRPEIAADPEEVRQFLEEGRHIAKIKHPNIVAVFDVLSQDGVCFFVMEHVAGTTVAQMLKQMGKVPPKKAREIVRDTAEALGHAWREAHIVHRNLKPENILLDEDGHAKLSFIGLAKTVNPLGQSADASEARTIVGTPHYMSPEQASCATNLDCRSDMYGLGATLYHMVTGRMPFEEFDPMVAARKHVSDFLHHPRDVDPAVSPALAQFMTMLLMKDRKDRHNNWQEVISDVKRLLTGQVIVRRVNPNAVSTIEPEAKPIIPTDPLAEIRPRRRRLYIPASVQIPAWAIILVWWYLLFRYMLDYWVN